MEGLSEEGSVAPEKPFVLLKHADKARYVTVPKHATVTIKPKTLETILKQAGLTAKQLRDLL